MQSLLSASKWQATHVEVVRRAVGVCGGVNGGGGGDAEPERVLSVDGGGGDGALLDGGRVADGAVAGLAPEADRVLLVRQMRHWKTKSTQIKSKLNPN